MSILSFAPTRNCLRVNQEGFNIHLNEIQNNATQLSAVRTLLVSINGQSISPENILFNLNNRKYKATNLDSANGETWHPQEPITLQILIPGLVKLGYHYEIEIEITLKGFDPVSQPEKMQIFKNILVAC